LPARRTGVLTGYGNPDSEFRRAIDLHKVGLAIGHLAHHASIGDDRGIRDGAASLQATLRRL